ncbi:MAG: hypothetical protein H6Q74_2816 [Firmicutes bacterium]|nr:hypothetical protein [Bacillota bacterium]
MWRISFPANGASELYYPHSGTYYVGSYQNKISNTTTLCLELGVNSAINRAIGTDSDWDYTQSSGLWYFGTFSTRGTSYFINLDWDKTLNNTSTIYYGYSFNRNAFNMTNGTYYIENYVVDTPPNTLPSLASSYTIAYQGPHIGLTKNFNLSPTIAVESSVAFTPLALVQGHGWWNLRSLDFIHTGTSQMWDAKLGLSYSPKHLNALRFSAGYRYQYLSLYQGIENTSSTITWDKATSINRGYYLTGSYKF